MSLPPDFEHLPPAELKGLVIALLAKVAALERTVTAQRDEIARLKNVPGRPAIKPSGMENATQPKPPTGRGKGRKNGGKKTARRVIHEDRVIKAAAPSFSRFKGYEDFVVQDLVFRPLVVRYRRERWLTPDGRTITAPMPAGVSGHFGAELQRYVLAQHHQGQVTVRRVASQLRAVGFDISRRQVMRLLIAGHGGFLDEAQEVLRAGLTDAAWVSVDDTGARHKAANGVCTQIGNDHFAWFGSTTSKSRLNFLDLLRAGHTDYVINAEALAYMQSRGLAGPAIAKLAEAPDQHFANDAEWHTHLSRLGIASRPDPGLVAVQDPVRLASEGALWGSVKAHGFLPKTVIVREARKCARLLVQGRAALNVVASADCHLGVCLLERIDQKNIGASEVGAKHAASPTRSGSERSSVRANILFCTATGGCHLLPLCIRRRAVTPLAPGSLG